MTTLKQEIDTLLDEYRYDCVVEAAEPAILRQQTLEDLLATIRKHLPEKKDAVKLAKKAWFNKGGVLQQAMSYNAAIDAMESNLKEDV